jgi:DNA-binding beta-propeller fold protein YncE
LPGPPIADRLASIPLHGLVALRLHGHQGTCSARLPPWSGAPLIVAAAATPPLSLEEVTAMRSSYCIPGWLPVCCVLFGCGADGSPTEPGAPAAIIVSPSPVTLPQLGAVQLDARVVDARGATVSDQDLTFASDDSTIATATSTGIVVSRGPAGSTHVRVVSGALEASVALLVTPTPVRLLARSPIVVLAGTSRQLKGTVLDAVGAVIPDAPVAFASSTPALTVTPEGIVSAGGQTGRFTVTATAESLTATIEVVVPTHPAGVIAGSQTLSLGAWGGAISSRGAVYITEPAQGAPALVRADLPSFTLKAGPAGLEGGFPLSVAFSSDGAFAYVPALSPGRLAIVDAVQNKAVDEVLALEGNLSGVLVSPDDSTVYVTSDNDLMYIIDVATRRTATTVDLGTVSNQLAWHPTLPHVLASSYNGGRIIEVDAASNTILRTLPIGGQPQGLAVSPDGHELYVADELGRLVVWDLDGNALLQEITVPSGAFGLALTPDAAQIYLGISSRPDGFVQIYDRVGRNLLGTINTGGSPRRIAFDIVGETAIVTNDASRVDFIR